MALDGFDRLTDDAAMRALVDCCSSSVWARRVAASRPFDSAESLLDAADRALAELPETEIERALDGHPRIGAAVTEGSASHREQAAVVDADQTVKDALAAGNVAYEEKFDHVYLVCATGRSATELLDILTERLDNDPETERRVMRAELSAITRIRLHRMLNDRPQR